MGSSENDGSPPSKKKRKGWEAESDDDQSSKSSDFTELDETVQQAIEDMDKCQNSIDALHEQASEEIIKIEEKFNKLRSPLYLKRNKFIGVIPNFWVTAMINHPQLSIIIDEDEEECLQFLSQLEIEEKEDIRTGFQISFHFDENPFFENDILVKDYTIQPESHISSTKIRWKENMDLSKKNKTIPSKRNRNSEWKTFFSWFSDENVDSNCDDIVEIIKEDLWSNPLQYFLVPDVESESEDSEEDEALMQILREEEGLENEGEDSSREKKGRKECEDDVKPSEPKTSSLSNKEEHNT